MWDKSWAGNSDSCSVVYSVEILVGAMVGQRAAVTVTYLAVALADLQAF